MSEDLRELEKQAYMKNQQATLELMRRFGYSKLPLSCYRQKLIAIIRPQRKVANNFKTVTLEG